MQKFLPLPFRLFPTTLFLYLFMFTFSACKKDKPCRCDLLDEKEKFFVKSGAIVETNSNKKALEEGKEAVVDLNLELSPKELKEQLNLLKGNVEINVPLMDFEKYHYDYQINFEKGVDRNVLLYFLTYCSAYPAYHDRFNNCVPEEEWKSKIENYRQLYLMPDTAREPNPAPDSDGNTRSDLVTFGKLILSGKVLDFADTEIGIADVEIYLGNEKIGGTSSTGAFHLTLLGNNTGKVLRFEHFECGSETYTIPKNNGSSPDIPILLKCK